MDTIRSVVVVADILFLLSLAFDVVCQNTDDWNDFYQSCINHVLKSYQGKVTLR